MRAYFAFTDESGTYQKEKSEKYLKGTPFYVRATVIISFEDYLRLQEELDRIKISFGLTPDIEVKWSHYGSALKNNYGRMPHSLTTKELKEYFEKVLIFINGLKSVQVYYTFTPNSEIGKIEKVSLIKMHLQNALQKVQTTVSENDGFAITIADDLNEETKYLKQAVYEMMLNGDYVKYTNVKKGLYIDFSNQCQGLQVADVFAGVFTATLKYLSSTDKEKGKFEWGYDLFVTHAYKNTRYGFYNAPSFDVYRYGVKQVPYEKGEDLAIKVSKIIEQKMEQDLWEEMNTVY